MKRGLITVLVFAFLSLGFASAAPHSEYNAFSEKYFNINGNTLTTSDKLIYNTGYVSINGQAWVPFTLNGDQYENYPFLLDGGQANLPNELGSEGTHFVIVFSCSLENNAWNCHGDDQQAKWQLEVITNQGNNNIPNPNPGEVEQADHYVAPNGNDNGPGTFENPWATWQKAFSNAGPGDLVYFRGGIYYATGTQSMGSLKGTSQNPIRFFAYPPDYESRNPPILDGSRITSWSKWTSGITADGAEHVHLKGLTVRNYKQRNIGDSPQGFAIHNSDNIILENCVAHDIGFRGYYFYNPGNMLIKNCDSYNNVDPLSDSPGNHGDGWLVWDSHSTSANLNSRVIFEGCRAWGNSDDGWDAESEGYIELNNCWAFDNGVPQFSYPGNGFKLGLCRVNTGKLERKVVNCISAGNGGSGFTTNDNVASCSNCVAKNMDIFNNLAYNNGYDHVIFRTSSSTQQELQRVYKNNIAYGGSLLVPGSYTHDHNSWDSNVDVSDNDFLSLDISQLYRPRKPDGSLPDITFGKLRQGSDLINAGSDGNNLGPL